MAAAGTAQFGSGLLSVCFVRPQRGYICLRVIIGECSHRAYNRYYDDTLVEADMSLVKTTSVDVQVVCAELGYDVTKNIGNLDFDPLVYDDWTDLSTIEGDSVRYFLIRNIDNIASPSITISTDAVSDSTGGRLHEITLAAPTLEAVNLNVGMLACEKTSPTTGVAGVGAYAEPKVVQLEGYDHGTGDPAFEWGAQQSWTFGKISAAVTYEDNGAHPFVGQLMYCGGNDSHYVGADLNTGARTYTAKRYDGVDETDPMGTIMDSVEVEPQAGMSGIHMKRILDKNPHVVLFLEDNIYAGAVEMGYYLPMLKTGDPYSAPSKSARSPLSVMESVSFDRATATFDELRLIHRARYQACLPSTIDAGQNAILCYNRGDHDLTPRNNMTHDGWAGTFDTDWADDLGEVTDTEPTVNPLADGNYDTRIAERAVQWKNCTDAWNLYFGGCNPPSFVRDRANEQLPISLQIDSTGAYVENKYSVDVRYYYCRGYTIENEKHCLAVLDMFNRRGGAITDSWVGNNYIANDPATAINYVYGGEGVLGTYQLAEFENLLSSSPPSKQISLANKSVIIGYFTNWDSAANSALAEMATLKAALAARQADTIFFAGDRHTTVAERAAGLGYAEE